MLQNTILCCNLQHYLFIGEQNMSLAVRVSDDLLHEARLHSKLDNRSVAGQIEYWAKIGKCAVDNPDLPFSLIQEILLGIEEIEVGRYSQYKFG